MFFNGYTWAFVTALIIHFLIELFLDIVQFRYLASRRERVPPHLAGKITVETVRKAVDYNRDKIAFRLLKRPVDLITVALMISFGFGWLDSVVSSLGFGAALTKGLLFLGFLGLAGNLWSLPWDAYYTFGIEQRHGFNRQKPLGFISDRIKEAVVGAFLGAVLFGAIVLAMELGGKWWWLIAFVATALFQLLTAWLYPVLILPLFNKFMPVEGSLVDEIKGLAGRVGFPLGGVVSMDGSKRSAHSNAFFTGFKGTRRVVLFDTLIEKLGTSELIAVIAHEFGHFKLGHTRRRLILVLFFMLCGFAGIGWLAGQKGAFTGLGFESFSPHGLVIVAGLLVSELLFPFGVLGRVMSRRDEFAADRFAVDAVMGGKDLDNALVALNKQNLSSPGSHKVYRFYYNTHPSLRERQRAIAAHAKAKGHPTKGGDKSDLGEIAFPVPKEGQREESHGDGRGADDGDFAEMKRASNVEKPHGE